MKSFSLRIICIVAVLSSVMAIGCEKEGEPIPSPGPEESTDPVNVNLDQVPYATLSEYQFFVGEMKDQQPQESVLPYALISKLFTDYAEKKRFVWMPDGTSASYVDDHQLLDFPFGTVIIKNFYYDGVLPSGDTRIIETRLLINRNGVWEFAEYVWNDEQTEAYLDLDGSYTPVSWVDGNGVQRDLEYRIPSGTECLVCHKKNSLPIPIGPKPQNLNADYSFSDGVMNQLDKWNEKGYLADGYPDDIVTVVKWDDPSQDLRDRVRSYIDINCGHCHAEGSHCDYRPMRFAYAETESDENLGICVEPDEELEPQLTHIIASGNIDRSMLYYRISSTDEAVRMPLLGRSIVHEEAVEMIREWIESLDPPCN